MTDITIVKRMLADHAQAVAEMLLPNGRKEGHEWRAGSVDGEKGQSLGVHLTGAKAGVWTDFQTGEGGDLLDLWKASRRLSLVEALDQARDYLGVRRPEPYRDPKPSYVRPPKPSCQAPHGKVLDYLTEERNIPGHALTAYKIGANADRIIFPYLLPTGELAMAKARKAEKGADPKPTAADCEPILFGWQAMPDDCRDLVITEGEIDALSWFAFGFPAMSVPFGGGKGAKQKWIENEFDRLDRFERIFISTDMDQPGEEAAEEIAKRLGRHRCYRVKLPLKDANDCLVAGFTAEQMAACLKAASNLDPEGLKRAGDYTDAVVRLFHPEPGEHLGYKTPYGKLDGRLLFRPGEVTLWSGASGAGKSQILSDCIVDWIHQGSRICLASLEMKPDQTLKRMAKQVSGINWPSRGYLTEAIMPWLDQGLLLYERVGKEGVKALLEIFDYARAKYGCDQFVIDSLMRLGIAGDDYTGQEKAIYEIVDWAITHGVHLHLVAHSRKAGAGTGVPETEDIKGAMEIGANAFNIITVWRDRRQEEDGRAAQVAGEVVELMPDRPGVIMNIAKQRNGDFEGKVGLWFDQASYRYQTSHDRGHWQGRRYLDFVGQPTTERAA